MKKIFLLFTLMMMGMQTHAQSFDFSCSSSSQMINIPSHQSHWTFNGQRYYLDAYYHADNHASHITYRSGDSKWLVYEDTSLNQRGGLVFRSSHEHFWQAAMAFANLNSNWNFQAVVPLIPTPRFLVFEDFTRIGQWLVSDKAPGYGIAVHPTNPNVGIPYRDIAYLDASNNAVYVDDLNTAINDGNYNNIISYSFPDVRNDHPNLVAPNRGSSTATATWNGDDRFRYDVTLDTALGATGWRGISVLDDGTETTATAAEVTTSVTGFLTPANVDNLASFRIEYLRNGAVLSSQTFDRPARTSGASSASGAFSVANGRLTFGTAAAGYTVNLDKSDGATHWRILSLSRTGERAAVSTAFASSTPNPSTWRYSPAADHPIVAIEYLYNGSVLASQTFDVKGTSSSNIETFVEPNQSIRWEYTTQLDESMGLQDWRIEWTKTGTSSRVNTVGATSALVGRNDFRHGQIHYLINGVVVDSDPIVSAPLTFRTAEMGDQVQVRLPGNNDAIYRTDSFTFDGTNWVGNGNNSWSTNFAVNLSEDRGQLQTWAREYTEHSPPGGGNGFDVVSQLQRIPLNSSIVNAIIKASEVFQIVDDERAVWRIDYIRGDGGLQLRSPNVAADIAILFGPGELVSFTNNTGWTHADYRYGGFLANNGTVRRDSAHGVSTILDVINSINNIELWPDARF